MADGKCTRRLNESRAIPAVVVAPFGKTISITSGTIDLYKGAEGDSADPLQLPELLKAKPITSSAAILPGTSEAYYTFNAKSLALAVGKYTMVFKLTVNDGGSSWVFLVAVVITVTSDTE